MASTDTELDEILEKLWEKRGRHSKLPMFPMIESINEAKAALLAWHHSALLREVMGIVPEKKATEASARLKRSDDFYVWAEGYNAALDHVRQQLLGRYGEGAK